MDFKVILPFHTHTLPHYTCMVFYWFNIPALAPYLLPSQGKGTCFFDIRQPISFHVGMDVGEHAYISST